MSSENEAGWQPSGEQSDPGVDATMQFDAFRARRAEEQAQQAQQTQQTQSAYSFPDMPQEYAAEPPAEAYGAAPDAPRAGGAPRWRSVAIFAGAVVAAGVVGLGAWALFGSSGGTPSSAAAGTTASATATGSGAAGSGSGSGAGKRTKALTFRVTIQTIGADSFTGKAFANGETYTIALTDKTHYGTKAHPFSQSELTVGQTVIVRGRRTGTGTITASLVADLSAATAGASASAATAATAATA